MKKSREAWQSISCYLESIKVLLVAALNALIEIETHLLEVDLTTVVH